MNNITSLENFYEEYRKINKHLTSNNTLNNMSFTFSGIFMTIIILYAVKIINLLAFIILLIATFFIMLIIMITIILGEVYEKNVFYILFNNKLTDIFSIIYAQNMKKQKLKAINTILREYRISQKQDIIFIYNHFQNRLNEEKSKKKSFFEVLSAVSLIVNILALNTIEEKNETTLDLYISLLFIYYVCVAIARFLKMVFYKNKVEIYTELLFDLELKILNYNKKLT